MAKNRIDHIDIAKAIGIVLIISSHIVCTTNFSKDLLLTTYWNVLGSFYVPFFFCCLEYLPPWARVIY